MDKISEVFGIVKQKDSLKLTEDELEELWKKKLGYHPDDRLSRMRQAAEAQFSKIFDKLEEELRNLNNIGGAGGKSG